MNLHHRHGWLEAVANADADLHGLMTPVSEAPSSASPPIPADM
jgi:hypothetical protein